MFNLKIKKNTNLNIEKTLEDIIDKNNLISLSKKTQFLLNIFYFIV